MNIIQSQLDISSTGYARALLENMVESHALLRSLGENVSVSDAVASVLPDVTKALANIPLENLRAQSDFVLHAEGPGATRSLPWLSSLSWLLTITEKNVRKLGASALDMWGVNDSNVLVRDLDIRVPGILPGSIWLGVKILQPHDDLLPADEALIERIATHLAALPVITNLVGDEIIDPSVQDVSPDPAIRDIQLSALLNFAPTGRKGIHTLEIGSKAEARASLSQRERVVIRQALSHPDKGRSFEGKFTGEVREADLDKSRIHLRNVSGVGTLRCVMPQLSALEARTLFGNTVMVEGKYQKGQNGEPRLMFVERITPVTSPKQTRLD